MVVNSSLQTQKLHFYDTFVCHTWNKLKTGQLFDSHVGQPWVSDIINGQKDQRKSECRKLKCRSSHMFLTPWSKGSWPPPNINPCWPWSKHPDPENIWKPLLNQSWFTRKRRVAALRCLRLLDYQGSKCLNLSWWRPLDGSTGPVCFFRDD